MSDGIIHDIQPLMVNHLWAAAALLIPVISLKKSCSDFHLTDKQQSVKPDLEAVYCYYWHQWVTDDRFALTKRLQQRSAVQFTEPPFHLVLAQMLSDHHKRLQTAAWCHNFKTLKGYYCAGYWEKALMSRFIMHDVSHESIVAAEAKHCNQ